MAPSPDWQQVLPHRQEELRRFATCAASAVEAQLRKSDALLLHDTQTAPLAGELIPWSHHTAWHGHIGTVEVDARVAAYWETLGSALSRPRWRLTYRDEYLPATLTGPRVIASPGLDAASRKNQPISRSDARAQLLGPQAGNIVWHGSDGLAATPRIVVAQLSRWDPLKEMAACVRILGAAARRVDGLLGLVIGPSAQSASERRELEGACSAWRRLPSEAKAAVHVGEILDCGSPEHDEVVRIVQGAADIVLQRSRREGFGLTVTEAMWRGAAVVASRTGAIPLQLCEGTGELLDPDADDERWASTVVALCDDAQRRIALGRAAHTAIAERHLLDRQLTAAIDGVLST
jgi:trehalose synthase